MCGIAGIISRARMYDPDHRTKIVGEMIATTVHRGPDHQEIKHLDEAATFGYARLAIIDQSAKSNQPMASTDGSINVVYNGELYNFKEIRQELEANGFSFRTAGDTEVILKAFELWREDAFVRFNGIFAVALYDSRTKELVLSCDRFAVKPLYFNATNASVQFCSDFRALAKGIEAPLELDPEAVASFCTLRYVPGYRTILKNITKLQPGEIIKFRYGRMVGRKQFWRPSFRPKPIPLADAMEQVQNAILTAVQRQIVGDAPYGILLSGGVDSAGILACVGNNATRRAFTAIYTDKLPSIVPAKADGRFPVIHDCTDESCYARLVADYCDAELTEVYLTFEELESSFEVMIRAMGEPMASIDAIGHFCFASGIDPKIKFLLSGVGADEIFGGYVELYFGSKGRLLNSRITPQDYLKIVGTPDRLNLDFMGILHASYRSLEYATDCFARCLNNDLAPSERLNETLQLFVAAADLPYWELKQADAMYMAFSKEVRVPFLDNDLFDLASTISASLKWMDSREKFILREALRPLLPSAVIDRKKFPSLGTPARFYSRPWFKERCRMLMSRDSIWDSTQMKNYLNGKFSGPPDLDVLYRFVVLDQWLREYKID